MTLSGAVTVRCYHISEFYFRVLLLLSRAGQFDSLKCSEVIKLAHRFISCRIKVFVLVFVLGVLGGTHPGRRLGCWPVRVPVLPRPRDEEEAAAGLSEGLGRAIQRGGDGRPSHQSGLRLHGLRRGKGREKGHLPGHAGRSAVFCMTITRTGNRDQSVVATLAHSSSKPVLSFQ